MWANPSSTGPGGNPAAVWKFSECPQCEDFLRHILLWAVTAAEIPETHDETKTREDFDKRGARDKDAILALALAKIAGTENLPRLADPHGVRRAAARPRPDGMPVRSRPAVRDEVLRRVRLPDARLACCGRHSARPEGR